MRIPASLLSLAVLAVVALPASAHHGWGGNSKTVEMTGKVVRGVSLSGPHANMQIQDAAGQIWDITLAPAPRTARGGLTEKTLPVGAEVTVRGSRNDNATIFEIKTRRVTYQGKNYDVYDSGAGRE